MIAASSERHDSGDAANAAASFFSLSAITVAICVPFAYNLYPLTECFVMCAIYDYPHRLFGMA